MRRAGSVARKLERLEEQVTGDVLIRLPRDPEDMTDEELALVCHDLSARNSVSDLLRRVEEWETKLQLEVGACEKLVRGLSDSTLQYLLRLIERHTGPRLLEAMRYLERQGDIERVPVETLRLVKLEWRKRRRESATA